MHRHIEHASLLALLVVAGLRPLIAETHSSAGQAITAALETVADPTPLRTVVLDVVILLAACGTLLSRVIGPRRRYRWTGLEIGGALVLAGMIASALVAGQKRLAINTALDWICLPVLAIALTQLLDRPWRRRVLAAVVLASGCAVAVRCFEQRAALQDTIANYEQIKADGFWQRQGVELDSPKVALFEQRLRSAEVDGGFGHSNVAGSYLALCAIAGVGAVVGGIGRGAGGGAMLVHLGRVGAVAVLLMAMVLTGSNGAILSVVIAGLVWLLVFVGRGWIASHRRWAFLLGWLASAGGLSAVVGHGLYHGSLPGSSLNFRWQYWTASAELIADHPLGVGGGNFGRHYTRYKTIESPEEVANPHNLLVHAAADWGVLGLVGVIAMLIGGSMVVARPVAIGDAGDGLREGSERRGDPELAGGHGQRRPGHRDKRAIAPAEARGSGRTPVGNRCHTADARGSGRTPVGNRCHTGEARGSGGAVGRWAWGACLLVLIFGLRIPLIDVDNAAYTYYDTVTTGLAWALGFALFSCVRFGGETRCDGLAMIALPAALFAFLLHDMINFATFVPGAATTLFALFALAVSTRTDGEFGTGGDAGATLTGGDAGAAVTGRDARATLPGRDARATVPGEDARAADAERVARATRWPARSLGVVAVCTVGVVWFIALPVGRAADALAEARRYAASGVAGRIEEHPAYRAYDAAARLDRLDPTPLVEQARWLAGIAQALPDRQGASESALAALDRAKARDPYDGGLDRLAARISLMGARRTGDSEAYLRAVQSARRALERYPADPRAMILLADCQIAAGEALADRARLREAVELLDAALALDAKRPNWSEEVRRLSDRTRAEIDARRRRVVEVLGSRPAGGP